MRSFIPKDLDAASIYKVEHGRFIMYLVNGTGMQKGLQYQKKLIGHRINRDLFYKYEDKNTVDYKEYKHEQEN